jgi:excisionase family DNA binding protein
MTEVDHEIQAPRLLLSVEDAADRLALSRTRLYALIKTGEIVSVRIGRLRRVPVEALTTFTARLIAEQTQLGARERDR